MCWDEKRARTSKSCHRSNYRFLAALTPYPNETVASMSVHFARKHDSCVEMADLAITLPVAPKKNLVYIKPAACTPWVSLHSSGPSVQGDAKGVGCTGGCPRTRRKQGSVPPPPPFQVSQGWYIFADPTSNGLLLLNSDH